MTWHRLPLRTLVGSVKNSVLCSGRRRNCQHTWKWAYRDLLHDINLTLNHYTRFEKPHFADRDKFSQRHANCIHDPPRVVSDSVGNKPVIASRIIWKHPPTFDASTYLLDPVVASVYDHPDTLRLPVSEWPQKSKARVHCQQNTVSCQIGRV